MAYATAEQLAEALRIRVTASNTEALDDCLAAAAAEIDASLDRTEPLPTPTPEILVRTNINRAVEWWKAADAAYGMVGFDQIGVLRTPADGFARHATTIRSLKQQWGVG